jgi:hypothetical protein
LKNQLVFEANRKNRTFALCTKFIHNTKQQLPTL